MCRSKTSGKPILTICPMSRATSSTRSVIITKSLCPRISLACCARCTLMESSSPTLKLGGREHSNCTLWAQRSVNPKLSPPEIQLLDLLYGEWGDTTLLLHTTSPPLQPCLLREMRPTTLLERCRTRRRTLEELRAHPAYALS